MKANDIIKTLLVAGVALVGLSSCQERLIRFTKGEAVKFTAGNPGLTTKATYGTPDPDEMKTVPIYWEEGDLVRIFCEECGSPEIGDPDSRYADYVVTGFGETMSQAHLAQQTETILRWGGEGKHNFYAVYPTPDVSTGISYFPSKTQDKDNLKLTASVPQTIAAAQAVDGVIKPDFKYQYMVAKTSADGWSDDNIGVFLTFKPLVTAINFTIQNKTGKELDIVGIALESAGHNISGTFTADLAGWNPESEDNPYPSCVSGTGDNVVQLSFKGYEGGHIALLVDETLNFTMFLAPCSEDVNDITFKLYKSDGTWVSTKLAYNDALKTGVPFPNHKMTYVTGLLVPDGAQWTVKYSADVNYWNDDKAKEKDPMPELKPEPFVTPWEFGAIEGTDMLKYNYSLGIEGQIVFNHTGTTNTETYPEGKSTLTITSKRELFEDDSNHIGNGTYTPLPVIWHLEYMDDEGQWVPAHKPSSDDDWIAGFLQLNPVIGTGDNMEIELLGDNEVEMKIKHAPATSTTIPPAPTTSKSHNSILQGTAAKGTSGAPYNLAMHDIYGNAREKAITANSYVINAPGVYAFPLVYGNSLNYNAAPVGGIFIPSFNPGGESPSTPTFLSRFHNGKGNPITSPYIDQDLGKTALTSVSILWQDATSLVTNFSLLTPAQAATKGLAAGNCSYVMFEVKAENITQGNAVIAVKDGSDTVWSWHIWVTDRDLTCTDKGMMPFNLGWVDDDCTTGYGFWNGASVRLRAVQNASGVIKEFTVIRKEEFEDMPNDEGSSPYWQWGRKDPFKRSGTISFDGDSRNIEYSINNPDKFINKDNLWYYQTEMVETETGPTPTSANYLNLWSAMNNGTGTSATGYSTKPMKTIYDPCPPGFQVPQGNAFTGWGDADMGILRKLGYRDNSSSGAVTESGTNGYYWTAVPASASGYTGVTAKYNGLSISMETPGVWSQGYSILPVKE